MGTLEVCRVQHQNQTKFVYYYQNRTVTGQQYEASRELSQHIISLLLCKRTLHFTHNNLVFLW